jgi:hypothetical protein
MMMPSYVIKANIQLSVFQPHAIEFKHMFEELKQLFVLMLKIKNIVKVQIKMHNFKSSEDILKLQV